MELEMHLCIYICFIIKKP